ncbi:MAG: SAM-dependent DNA methyltransferase [Pirellulales bacterium]|nr:SAM-dependent DNA methyltransferase [Pirellulales bacterium]
MKVEMRLPPRAKFNPELGIYDLDWSDESARKKSGSYYTPPCLIDCLLDFAIKWRVESGEWRETRDEGRETRDEGRETRDEGRGVRGEGRETYDNAIQAHSPLSPLPSPLLSLPSPLSPLPLKICDPACGTGHFLVPAARRIARRLAMDRWGEEHPSAEKVQAMLTGAIEHCIYGADIESAAVELCRYNLWLAAGQPAGMPPLLERRIRRGDSLFFPWRSAFPEVFADGGFDAVIGNPPFVNAIEGAIPPETKKRLAALSRELRGTADLAFHFVRLSHELVRAGGTVGLVLPKTFLNADAAVKLRERLCRERPPSMIHVPPRGVYFPGASAYTCLVVLGGDSTCAVSDDESPAEAAWRRSAISHSNWWRSVQTILGRLEELPPGEFVPLGAHFEVAASMTAGDAYAVKPFVRDDAAAGGPKFVTTGLIEPFACNWGRKECRYLGSTYARPRIVADGKLSPPLAARLKKAATRPKLLVAGLCDRFEAFFDPHGEYLGAVSTYSIFHPEDDVHSLEKLCAWLNSPRATALLRAELGAASVGGGFMTLKKKTLQELPVPIGSRRIYEKGN